jgi:SAM-dependent methyltransferase
MEKNINKIYPMLDGGPIFRLSDFKALKHRVLLKIKRSEGNADTIDVSDNQKDSRFDFDEYPDCESCGMSGAKFVLKAIDGNRIVECENFGLRCGCGYLLKAAQDMGVYAAGNDLNRYAVDRMRELFGFDVYTGLIYDLLVRGDVKKDDFDIVYMNDYIEHSFHPKKDLKAAFEMLKKNGVAYLTTFCIDSERFDKLGEKWDMLMCNIHSSGGMVEICGRKI